MLQKESAVWFRILLFIILISGKKVFAQKALCSNAIRGTILSSANHEVVPFAQIQILGSGMYSVSDSLGYFEFCNLSPGIKTLLIKQLGYDSAVVRVEPGHKRRIIVHLNEKDAWLDAIDVVGKHRNFESEVVEAQTIQKQELDRSRGSSLGEITRKIPGVSVLQTGPSLFKPVIQGLTGQRIAILNNGSKMEGQQWGFDHAPELDANSATRVTLVKGAQAVRYGADAIGGVILVEQGEVDPELKSISGRSTSGFATNGNGFFESLMLENRFGKNRIFSWRVTASGRKSGDYTTARYVMGNTAMQEGSASGLLAFSQGKWKTELWASYYATRIAIFSGSHISSPEGIRLALSRPDSSYTYSFGYGINRPMQKINHLQLKAKAVYQLNENQNLELVYNHQVDHRKEFDIIRTSGSGCSDCPQLLFRLESQQLEINHQTRTELYEGRTGFVGLTQGNVVERRILIPNFRLYQAGFYSVHSWFRDDWAYEFGIRAEGRQQQIYRYVGQQFQKPVHQYLLFMTNAGIRKELGQHWHAKFNAQISRRPPNVNELYSNGVHHGTASFEKGDEALNPEQIANGTLSLHHRSQHWQVLLNMFGTWSPNFIYLSPIGDSIVSTIRGPYPFYRYQATEVLMKGADIAIDYEVNKHIALYAKGLMIRSWNVSQSNYLIFQPADRIESGIQLGRSQEEKGTRLQLRFGPVWVSRQYRAPSNLDFAEAPAGYTLWNGQLAWSKEKGKFRYDLSLEGQNLFNKAYRDYMNRFRYFTYDPGRNLVVRFTVFFGAPNP